MPLHFENDQTADQARQGDFSMNTSEANAAPDAAEEQIWENTYWCQCGETWQAEMDSQCDDRCGVCDTPMTPFFSSLVIR